MVSRVFFLLVSLFGFSNAALSENYDNVLQKAKQQREYSKTLLPSNEIDQFINQVEEEANQQLIAPVETKPKEAVKKLDSSNIKQEKETVVSNDKKNQHDKHNIEHGRHIHTACVCLKFAISEFCHVTPPCRNCNIITIILQCYNNIFYFLETTMYFGT